MTEYGLYLINMTGKSGSKSFYERFNENVIRVKANNITEVKKKAIHYLMVQPNPIMLNHSVVICTLNTIRNKVIPSREIGSIKFDGRSGEWMYFSNTTRESTALTLSGYPKHR